MSSTNINTLWNFEGFVFNQHKPMEICWDVSYGFLVAPGFFKDLQFPDAVVLALEIVGQPGFGAQG